MSDENAFLSENKKILQFDKRLNLNIFAAYLFIFFLKLEQVDFYLTSVFLICLFVISYNFQAKV